jgi:UDPglucose 6-dehydrogenase
VGESSTVIDIGVIGTGYLGAVHAACLADLGHRVVGVDVDPAKVAGLSAGVPDFFEPGLEELLASTLPTGRLTFSTNYEELASARVVFLCVGTPQVSGGVEADTSYLFDAVRSLAPHLDERCLVVGKSTVPVGTAPRLARELAEQAGRLVRMAWNPEFLREGHAIADTQMPSRLVYGLDRETAAEDAALLDQVYAHPIAQGVPRVVTDIATAELVKGAANAFLATKISFINTIADICERAGGDVSDLATALGLDDRIGPAFLGAGVGFGGGCLPKDIRAFAARARDLGVDQAAALLSLVDEINLGRRTKVVALATEMLGGTVRDKQIAILGFAFKPDSDDTRDAPALAIAARLVDSGAIVRLHDPRAAAPKTDAPGLSVAVSAHDAIAGADLVLHVTEWPEYRALDPVELRMIVAQPNVLDARNRLDGGAWRAAGWTFQSLGSSG